MYRRITGINRYENFFVRQPDLETNAVVTVDHGSEPPKIAAYRSFGTLLKSSNKDVAEAATTFRTVAFRSTRPLPESFDGRVQWAGLMCDVMDQGACGGCWAYASASALADRFAIATMGQIKFQPGPAELIICAHDFSPDKIQDEWKNISYYEQADKDMRKNMSCNGASLYDAMALLYTSGITEQGCFPDRTCGSSSSGGGAASGGVVNPKGGGTSTDSGTCVQSAQPFNLPATSDPQTLPFCYKLEGLEFDTCVDGKTAMRKYRAQTVYGVDKVIDAIKTEIIKHGPITVGFMVYSDLMYNYDGKSVYTHPDYGKSTNQKLGGHAVACVGWGVDKSDASKPIEYWIIKNSWGSGWGDNGYFKIQIGLPECELESNVVAMIPDFPGMVITDPAIIPLTSDVEAKVQALTQHYLDLQTGYYTSALSKLNAGTLQTPNPITNYLKSGARLPDFSNYYAMDINKDSLASAPADSTYPSASTAAILSSQSVADWFGSSTIVVIITVFIVFSISIYLYRHRKALPTISTVPLALPLTLPTSPLSLPLTSATTI